MRKSVELQEADRDSLPESGDALRAKPCSLNANDSLGKTIRFALVPNFYFGEEWQDLSKFFILADQAAQCRYWTWC